MLFYSGKLVLPTPSADALGNIEVLCQEANLLINAGISAKSQQTYKTALNQYVEFATLNGVLPWPMDVGKVLLFIAHLSATNKSYNTISTYVAGLNNYLKLRNQPDITSSFLVKRILEGAKRLKF